MLNYGIFYEFIAVEDYNNNLSKNVLKLENMNSKSNNSLFDEYKAKGKTLCTIVDGRIVYSDQKFNL